MFIYLLYRLYSVAQQAEDLFGRLLTIGVFSHVALQVILNLMVVTSLFPHDRRDSAFLQLWRDGYRISPGGDWNGTECGKRKPL